MAPKRPPPMEEPPAASTSSEEEEATSSGEEEEEGSSSSSEEEDEEAAAGPPTQKPSSQKLSSLPPQPPPPKSAPKKPDSTIIPPESDSDSESGSDSDSPAAVKPIASKPMEETPTKKPRSKPSAASSKSTAVKRASETDVEAKDSKRPKKDSEVDGVGDKSEEKKVQLFQRLWSEDDEIAVLKGIIDFTTKKGIDPFKDMSAFHEFVKNSLHFDVSLNQVKEKIGRLKKKFEKHVNRSKFGEGMTFSKPHDQKAFNLWKKIWGSEATSGGGGAESSAVKSHGKVKNSGNAYTTRNHSDNSKILVTFKADKGGEDDKMEVEVEKNSTLKQKLLFEKGIGVARLEDYVINKGIHVVKGDKKAEMEAKWRKLHVAELELFLKRQELIVEQTKLMLASYETDN